MPTKDIEQLKNLKTKIDNKEMSVLVGAGFSKNVSEIFPSWWQLLFDMTYFLFETEIDEALSVVKKPKSTFNREEFINAKISNYIAKIGYLDIVSEFIKRKGYREAITSYIEEKTPRITKSGNNYYLENKIGNKKNRVKIKEEMLTQHKLLLELPWNNIYTTNYDELLEHSNDSTTSKSITSEIDIIEHEMQLLQGKKSRTQFNIEHLREEIDSLTTKLEELEKILNYSEKGKLEDQVQNKQSEYRKEEFNINGIHRRITDKERDLLQLKKAQNECITTVKSSEDLSIKRNKNIIKLHGSLRSNESKYGFDGDIKKHYIIAREDYETYPAKHEAFTQLMRISLLQESYCLIGFSGDDTNFLEWIKWVREILARGNSRTDYKIYLISLNTSPISEDKLLFFENHKVYPISIMTDEVVDFMEIQTGLKLEKRSYKPVIELFLKYLRGKHQVNISKTIFEMLQLNKYKRGWDSIASIEPKTINYEDISSKSETLFGLKEFNQLPSLNFAYSNRKHSLLFYSETLIKNAPKRYRTALLKLIILAIRDSYLTPTDFVWNGDSLYTIEESIKQSTKAVQKEFALLMLRDSVLRRDSKAFNSIEFKLSGKSDDQTYEYLLITAFSLDFKTLKYQLESWNPKSEWIIKKTGLLAMFDSKTALELISSQLGDPLNKSQEEAYRLELYRYVKQSVVLGFDKNLIEAINTYKLLGLTPISENLDYLIEETNKRKDKIKRYGEGRFSISNEFIFSNDFTSPQKGLQFLQQMMETGFPLSINHINWKNSKDCYPLFKEVFQHFPFPSIFYALQFSDEKFLRRLGQDFAYSESLKSSLDGILKTLLNAYLNDYTPYSFKQSILYFSSELFIASDPFKWQDLFLQIWNTKNFSMRSLKDRYIAERTFTVSCLPYLQDALIINELIIAILANPNSNYSVELLYHLAKNSRLEELGSDLQSQDLMNAVESIIESLSENETAIFIVGNLYSILTTAQKKMIFKKLKKIDFNKIKNGRIWSVLIYLSKFDQEIIHRVKSAIINNKKLFYAGFTDEGLSMGVEFINVSKLSNSKDSKHIEWKTAEAKKIFRKIISELRKIEGWLDNREHNFTSILHEMLLFLQMERSKIESEKEYKSALKTIRQLYNQHRGYEAPIDGLVSTDNSVVVWALSELSIFLYQKKSLVEHEFEVATLLNKLLLQAPPSLEASLNYLAVWINSDELSGDFRKHANAILSILKMYTKKYTKNELEGFDKPFVFQQLIDIAKALDSWKIQNLAVNHWLQVEKETSFNNIKFRKSK